MQDDTSPEEKLLKLITNTNQTSSNKSVIPEQDDPSSRKHSSLSLTMPASIALKSPSVWRYAMMLLTVINVLACILLAYQYLFNQPVLSFFRPAQSLSRDQQKLRSEKTEQLDEKHTMQVFSKRELFKTYIKPIKIRTSAEKSVTISELLKTLHLVGIISGDNAQAIIEDKSSGQMHYVVKGDRVGDLIVLDVLEDKVRLSYENEEAQLTL